MQRLIVFILSGIATIFGLPAVTSWFADTASLAAVVMALIAGIRKAVPLDGIVVTIAAVIAGGVLAGVGWAAGLVADAGTLGQAVLFGLGAGWLATGGWDAISALIAKLGKARADTPTG